jgi:hypothetical protein
VKRIAVGLVAAALLGLSVAVDRLGAAQDNTPTAFDQHPIVGSWRFAGGDPFLYSFFADGGVIATDEEGRTYHGAWQPVTEADVTFALESLVASSGTMGEGFQGLLTVGADTSEVSFQDGTLRRIVPPELSEFAAASPAP